MLIFKQLFYLPSWLKIILLWIWQGTVLHTRETARGSPEIITHAASSCCSHDYPMWISCRSDDRRLLLLLVRSRRHRDWLGSAAGTFVVYYLWGRWFGWLFDVVCSVFLNLGLVLLKWIEFGRVNFTERCGAVIRFSTCWFTWNIISVS